MKQRHSAPAPQPSMNTVSCIKANRHIGTPDPSGMSNSGHGAQCPGTLVPVYDGHRDFKHRKAYEGSTSDLHYLRITSMFLMGDKLG